MATRPNTQGGASAPSNVVRLPTAAQRKVKQPWNRKTSAARDALPCQLRDRYIMPSIRAALDDAQLLQEVERTPALVFALALFEAMDEKTQRRAEMYLSLMALSTGAQGSAAKAALALAKRRTVGSQIDLSAAIRLIQEGRA